MNRSVKYDFSCDELKLLGVDFKRLEDYGMKKIHMINFGFTFREWRELGFTKDDLIRLRTNFRLEDLEKLNWDYRIVRSKFKLNAVEEEFILQGAKIKLKRT